MKMFNEVVINSVKVILPSTNICNERTTQTDFIKTVFDPEAITLVIRFKKYEVKWERLEKLPNSRLGKIRYASSINEIQNLCDEVDVAKNELFFNRSSRSFETIIEYYYSQNLHFDTNICIIAFNKELKYWGIDTCDFDPCCSFKFHQMTEDAMEHISTMEMIETRCSIALEQKAELFNNCCCPTIRKKMWDIMEYPNTSYYAKAFTMISIFFIIASTSNLVLSTFISDNNQMLTFNSTYNQTHDDEFDQYFETIEAVYMIWFTLEFILRLWASPNPLKFLKGPLNIIDLISIVPFYVSLLLQTLPQNLIVNTTSFRHLFTMFRVLRILRIFKLARHSNSLKSLGQTIRTSANEFSILFMFLALAVLLFSNLIYFAEKDVDNTGFTSIPATFWWAVTTITTVGYGDIYPTTTLGRIIGGMCCISGVLVLAMPISIIVDNFQKISDHQKLSEKAIRYRQENLRKIEERQNLHLLRNI